MRIQLAENYATKVFKAKTIILVENYDELVKLAYQKFMIKSKRIRLFIAVKNVNADIGTEFHIKYSDIITSEKKLW